MTTMLDSEIQTAHLRNRRPGYAERTYVMKGAAAEKALDTYHLILAPTHACNLRCRHCYLPDHASYVMPFAQVQSLMEQWSQIVLRDRGPLGGYFHLKGGEPLILPYLCNVLDLLARKKSLRFMMTTNGTFLRQPFRKSLLRLNDAVDGEVIVIVSLDGSKEEVHRLLRGPGNFAKTERFARTLIGDGINVHLNYVVHSGNLHDVPDFVEFAEALGATQVNFLPMVPKGFGAEMGAVGRPDAAILHGTLFRLFKEGDRRRRQLLAGNYADILTLERSGSQTSAECVAGYKGLFYITPEGDVYSCPNLVNSGLKLGNCVQTELTEIHDVRISELYTAKLLDPTVDERYMCRGERFSTSPSNGSPRTAKFPIPIVVQHERTEVGYPDAIRQVQEILLQEGMATKELDKGISYCFSRNF